MHFKKYIYLILFLAFLNVQSKEIIISSDDIRNFPDRDLYDILIKYHGLNGISLGQTGRPFSFSNTGKPFYIIFLYIDDIPYREMPLRDISFIPVESIEKIIIDDSPLETAGISLKIVTKKYENDEPLTAVRYKDAFHNFRELSADIAQNFNTETSFIIRGGIKEYKDNRESSDNFTHPYEKQYYHSRVISGNEDLKFIADVSCLKEKKFLISPGIFENQPDSTTSAPLYIRTAFSINGSFAENFQNSLSLIGLREDDNDINSSFILYDRSVRKFGELSLGSDLRLSLLRHGSEKEHSGYFGMRSSFDSFFKTEAGGSFLISDKNRESLGFKLNFTKQYPAGILFESLNTWQRSQNSVAADKTELTDNFINTGFLYNNGLSEFRTSAGYRIISNIVDKTVSSFFFGELDAGFKNMVTVSSGITKRVSGNKNPYDSDMNITGSIVFSNKYFNDKLDLILSLHHRYSEYFLEDTQRKEFMNVLSFNFSAKILDFEFFFGGDNFLKDKYNFSGNTVNVNPHYNYSAFQGFDMPLKDEIWGVRWIFYN